MPTNIKPCKLKLEYNSYTEYKLSIFHVLLKLMRFHPAKRYKKKTAVEMYTCMCE